MNQTQPDRAFAECLPSLTVGQKLALLSRMQGSASLPEPARVWVVVRDTGGCLVRVSAEAAGD